ncbi:hypothetical protein GQX74_004992 [Glossina fuscipes]|nr:hypothetical protein GQX74_004992 [Glossina fuscipes]
MANMTTTTNSVYAASLAAVSRVEQVLSEAASSLSSFTPRPGPQRPWMIQIKRGQVCASMEQWHEAKQYFLNATAANPNHTDALRALGETHNMLGEHRLAEKLLKDAAKLDPNCPRIW